MSDLKLCPFCGGRGITAQSPILERAWRVSCTACLAASSPHASEAEAIENWNRRAVGHALQAAIEHIEHMAAFIGDQKLGYSFESLGEDMPGIRAALTTIGDDHD